MAKIQIDGKFYEVSTEKNLLETCLALGFDVPYFCNHPAMGSVGACRQCAVKKYANADDKKGKIVMSCMEAVSDGLIISIDDPDVKVFRAAVIESLMTNHPHDCPICDEGGECQLQDMTVMTGHDYRRFVFRKRTHWNQYLGPFIQHEMNRCIQCYRCVRFYNDYAGGKDFNVFGSARQVYFGRAKEGLLENEFSGNLAEVCPTGVFTDKTHKRHYTRKWDLTNAPSICVHCSLGCNIIVSERYGMVRRIMSRYNGSVNGYFICDRGRFGYEFINNSGRIKTKKERLSKESDLIDSKDVTINGLHEALNSGKIIGIGSPRASLESNFALSSFVGKKNFYHGISRSDHTLVKKAIQIMTKGFAHVPSLKDIEKCDAIFILGEDVTNTAPMLALALRQASRNKSFKLATGIGIPKWNDTAVREVAQNIKSPLFIASPYSTKLDELAEELFYLAPEDISRLGFAVASAINPGTSGQANIDKKLNDAARRIADSLLAADNPLIVTGITLKNEDILNTSANIALALSNAGKNPSLSIILPECNTTGLAMLDGGSLDEALEKISGNNIDTLIILENDLYLRAPKEKIDPVFEKCRQVIVMDHLMNETAKKADLLLPAATFAESDGTIVNNEGRAQRFYSVLPLREPVKESWRWIIDMAKISEKSTEFNWEKFDDVVSSMVSSYPLLSGLKDKIPRADFRFYNEKIARQDKRYSGRTALQANLNVSEPKLPDDKDTPLDFSMEGYKGYPPSSLNPHYWSPGWNSYQSMFKYMDVPDGHLKDGDPGIRLFSDNKDRSDDFFKISPDQFKSRTDELLIVPVCRIFGSEELSAKAEAISECIAEPFIILNDQEIKRGHLIVNVTFEFSINRVDIKAKVLSDNTVPDGMAGLYNLTTMPYVDLPAWGKVLNSNSD